MHYLDNAATTPVHPWVAARIGEVLELHFANPSSLYAPGMRAEDVIEDARKTILTALGLPYSRAATRPGLVFTGSGTEANNLALLGAARARANVGREIVATGYEHPSVANTLAYLAEKEGFTLHLVPPGPDGRVDPAALVRQVNTATALVALIHCNNETGAVLDVADIAARVRKANPRTAIHVDAIQSFTKLPLALANIDTLALSGHKIGAPKGIGALYVRPGFSIQSVLFGGGQEGALRPGTQNTAYIAGFAEAVSIAQANHAEDIRRIASLNATLRAALGEMEGVVLNSPPDACPSILNFSCPGLRSEVLLHHLEKSEVYVSSGSACSGGAPSHTLTAMGLPRERVDSAVRVGFGPQNTPADLDALLAGLKTGLASLARAR